MDDFKKIIYGVLIGFVVLIFGYLTMAFVFSCGLDVSCKKAQPIPVRTSIPSMVPATMPVPTRYVAPEVTATTVPSGTEAPAPTSSGPEVPRPSNSGGPGEAVNLTGDAGSGAALFAANCVSCHGQNGVGGVANPGSIRGTVPSLNPIDPLLKDADRKVFAYNLDLFIQHGSIPQGTSPVFQMPAWGDLNALTQQQIADIIAYLISLNQ